MSSLEWVKDLDYNNLLYGDMQEIAELIGIDNTLRLWERFGKVNVYFTEKPLMDLKRKYIQGNSNKPTKELARLLGVSERYVELVKYNPANDDSQPNLFED